jgi:hypothetical protein
MTLLPSVQQDARKLRKQPQMATGDKQLDDDRGSADGVEPQRLLYKHAAGPLQHARIEGTFRVNTHANDIDSDMQV